MDSELRCRRSEIGNRRRISSNRKRSKNLRERAKERSLGFVYAGFETRFGSRSGSFGKFSFRKSERSFHQKRNRNIAKNHESDPQGRVQYGSQSITHDSYREFSSKNRFDFLVETRNSKQLRSLQRLFIFQFRKQRFKSTSCCSNLRFGQSSGRRKNHSSRQFQGNL
ncbi:hypothetical protein D3C71_459390 [compost metagenome]